MTIPTEPVGSVPRPAYLLDAMQAAAEGRIDAARLDAAPISSASRRRTSSSSSPASRIVHACSRSSRSTRARSSESTSA